MIMIVYRVIIVYLMNVFYKKNVILIIIVYMDIYAKMDNANKN